MPNWPFFLSLVKPRPVPLIAATCALRKELVVYMCYVATVAQKKNNFVFSSAAHHLFILTKHFCCNRPQSPLLLN